ncbi:ATP-grasp domain-containing protein [Sphaerotilus sp.]|uniref:carboxylate--amine ligase n=1 Tax=Sphaerotilus sp. TaxID=2093942 RepID=UPI002ACEBDB1|nr:ATP-grasp domain-containing protein [Sphaerotilus sp.]MDZ7855219.1 ATP-grasp domain-containing protein [Sphaerotilus sp.]
MSAAPTPAKLHIPAVVLSCMGAPEGDLNAVRSLGERGVPVIVISEYDDPPSRHSRHCREFILLPGYTQNAALLATALRDIHDRHGAAPVVFPTADPDLAALQQVAPGLGDRVRSTLADAHLVDAMADKSRFDRLAQAHGMPVPCTAAPRSLDEVAQLAATRPFPMIAKPAQPTAWMHPAIAPDIAQAKAIVLPDADALMHVARQLAPHGLHLIVQDYVPGDDDTHFTVDVYIDAQDRVRATCSGIKRRHYPAHLGSGCYCEGVERPELEALAARLLQDIGYRGLANLDFKRHAVTGDYRLLEINPRLSQWHILATRCGRNLPWLAYRDACGLAPEPLPARRTGVHYLSEKNDLRAMRQYRREGAWPLGAYLRSVLRPGLVLQLLALDDLGPARAEVGTWLARRLKRLGQWWRRPPGEARPAAGAAAAEHRARPANALDHAPVKLR